VLGLGGEVEPAALDLPPWAGPVLGFEIVLPADPVVQRPFTAAPPPTHPATRRDLAFLVPPSVPAGRVAGAIRAAGTELLESVEVFDLYEGDDLPDGVRSIAYALRFRARDRTLTDDEVDRVIHGVLDRVKSDAGVEPRG
jgi:phenylalanyl-tRNA synthetase beta chain